MVRKAALSIVQFGILLSALPSSTSLVGNTFLDNSLWQGWCLQSETCWPTGDCVDLLQPSAEHGAGDGHWPVCLDNFRYEDCLVYSVGVSGDWSFDELMGRRGCEVHSFDPTVDLPTSLAPNVTFHQWGLLEGSALPTVGHAQHLGSLYTLQQVLKRLNHKKITILKVDCEGCEWELFSHLLKHHELLPDQIAVEFHLEEMVGISASTRMRQMSDAFRVLAEGGYERVWYHDNTHPTPIYKEFISAGIHSSHCCRELVFKRPGRLSPNHKVTQF